MGSGPAGSVEVAIVAVPPAKVDVPRTVAPLVKVTEPVALVGSFAVKVTV